jgi:hypothetical protein
MITCYCPAAALPSGFDFAQDDLGDIFNKKSSKFHAQSTKAAGFQFYAKQKGRFRVLFFVTQEIALKKVGTKAPSAVILERSEGSRGGKSIGFCGS